MPSLETVQTELETRLQDDPAAGPAQETLDAIASLVLEALNVPTHPFSVQVEKLMEWIDENHLPRGTLLAPRPGSSLSQARSFWQVQLLLLITAQRQPQRLANRLQRDRPSLVAAAENARATISQWNGFQMNRSLVDSLHWLQAPLDIPPFMLEGNILQYEGRQVALSPQEKVFVEVLLANGRRAVSAVTFSHVGIDHHQKIKSRLTAKLDREWPRRRFHIRSAPGGSYQLDW